MENNEKEFLQQLNEFLEAFDWKAVEHLCENLCQELYSTDLPLSNEAVRRAMKMLRRKRRFNSMLLLGDVAIQTKRADIASQILYAQALIETGHYTAVIAILEMTERQIHDVAGSHGETNPDYAEMLGLKGRAYKQLYVRSGGKGKHSQDFASNAINCYLRMYKTSKENIWHGINAVAMLVRSKRDNIDLTEFSDASELANEIMATVNERLKAGRADAWDFATAAEACLALAKNTDALEWLSGYAATAECDAFELGSTLRQLEEVWQLDMNTEAGQLLLPILRAELLKREGGQFSLDPQEIMAEQAVERKLTSQYEQIIKAKSGGRLEKVFSLDSFKTYKWYMEGAARCLAVARIGPDETRGTGTGFLVRGEDLHPSLKGELLLLTNSHVVSEDPMEKALHPDEANVLFEVLSPNESFKIKEVVWCSPSTELDTALLRFEDADQQQIRKLTELIKFYPISPRLPLAEDPPTQKIYIIGHPQGGTLQLSFQDNHLIDHEDPKIHYRTPTDQGNSGSPIFNQSWSLVGLHHSGDREMACLNGKEGFYEANEGIWIESIKRALTTSILNAKDAENGSE